MSQVHGLVPASTLSDGRLRSESYAGGKRCVSEDLVLNRLKAHLGVFARAPQDGVVSPDYSVFRPVRGNTRYYERLFKTPQYISVWRQRVKGIVEGFWRLYTDDFYAVPVPLPPIEEQNRIADFLDSYSALVAKFIRSKRQQIDVFKEYKRALIRAAVCRGFGNSQHVPSRVGWIGDVPAHWSIQRLKVVTSLQRGYDLPVDSREQGEYPVVSSGGPIGTHSQFRSFAPGIVMGRYGSTESVFFIEKNFWPHNTSLFVTDFHGNEPKWCFYLLKTIPKGDLSAKSAVPGIDRNDLHEMYVPCPPIQEQSQIVEALELQLRLADEYAERVQREIDLAREYRTRLIADIVTGQVDVRNAIEPHELVRVEDVGFESTEEAEAELEEAPVGDE